jgi:hypothetical protein
MTSMSTDLNSLKLSELQIPPKREAPKGFLELCGQSYRETVNSTTYKGFLDQANYPDLAKAFIAALLKVAGIIDLQGALFERYEVITEWSTGKGFINLVILDRDNRAAIVIENKIYHYLHNDLSDYFNSLKDDADDITGLVLALTELPLDEQARKLGFKAITHSQWLDEVKANLKLDELPNPQHIYLNDFIATMEWLRYDTGMDERTHYYFENAAAIQEAKELHNEAVNFITSQLTKLRWSENWDTYGQNTEWIQFWPKSQTESISYVCEFKRLHSPEQDGRFIFTVAYQLEGDAMQHYDELKTILQSNAEYDFSGLFKNANARYLAKRDYELTIDQLVDWVGAMERYIKDEMDEHYNELVIALSKHA